MGVHYTCSGDFSKTFSFLDRLQHKEYLKSIEEYGRRGVEALRQATPKDTGTTANSWYYEIEQGRNQTTIHWCNDNLNDGVNIALILQYGHGLPNGTFVKGIDYINPALKDVFDDLAKECWKEVVKE